MLLWHAKFCATHYHLSTYLYMDSIYVHIYVNAMLYYYGIAKAKL